MFENYQQVALEKHNELRRRHGNTPDMELDADLCKSALKWAEHLSSTNTFSHSGPGENLYWASGHAQTDAEAVAAVDSWYSEIDNYDFATGESSNGKVIGRFTQVVWDESAKLGIGMARNGPATVVVGHYRKYGNFTGTYTSHVHPVGPDAPAISKPEAPKPKENESDAGNDGTGNDGGFSSLNGPGSTTETKTVYIDYDGDGIADAKQVTVTKTDYIDIDGDGTVDAIRTSTSTRTESLS